MSAKSGGKVKSVALAKSAPCHCFDFIAGPEVPLPATVVLDGHDSFLIEKALRHTYACLSEGDTEEIPPQKFEGAHLEWRTLNDELATGSLFSHGHSQPVVVSDAAQFISKYRSELEKWVADPNPTSTLILVSDTWLATTKLYKLVEQHGLRIVCDPPTASSKSKSPDIKRITKWIHEWAQVNYGLLLPSDVVTLLWELSQNSFGMVDTSLAKLSLLFEPQTTITVSDIRTHVGGWKAETVWQAIDEALDGRSAEAIATLHPIFHAGEHPLSVMGQMSWTLRRYAVAYDHYNQVRSQGGRADMKQSLLAAGFREWAGEIEKAAARLKQLGRRRLDRLHRWLLDIDLALKGTHSDEELGRHLIERLLISLAERN